MRLLISFLPLYANEAESVVGRDAGSGEVSAENGAIPANTCNAGVVIALPPLPNIPERNPITAPIEKISIHLEENTGGMLSACTNVICVMCTAGIPALTLGLLQERQKKDEREKNKNKVM